MLEMLISAFLLGVAITIPPGPVLLEAGRKAATTGFWPAFTFNAGAMCADTFYVLLVYFGLAPLIMENAIIRVFLGLVGGAWLLWLGVAALRTRIHEQALAGSAGHMSGWHDFISGIGVTLVNPLAVAGWVAVAGGFFANWAHHWPPAESVGLLAVLAMLAGVLAWMVGFIMTLSRLGHFFNPRTLNAASIVTGCILIVLGVGLWQSTMLMIL